VWILLILLTILSRDFSHFFLVCAIVLLCIIQQFSPPRLQVCSTKSVVICQAYGDSSQSLYPSPPPYTHGSPGRQTDGHRESERETAIRRPVWCHRGPRLCNSLLSHFLRLVTASDTQPSEEWLRPKPTRTRQSIGLALTGTESRNSFPATATTAAARRYAVCTNTTSAWRPGFS